MSESIRLIFKEGTSDKFWAITLNGKETTVTYGKSGSSGQSQTKSHANAAAAKKFYDKSVQEKTKKGYKVSKAGAGAAGKRKADDDDDDGDEEEEEEEEEVKKPAKRTRGAPVAEPASDKEEEEEEDEEGDDDDDDNQPEAPLRFTMALSSGGYGLYADSKIVVAGDEDGTVIECSHTATDMKVLRKFKLPAGVKAIVKDGSFLYCGTNEGELIDLTQEVPRVISKIENFDEIYWLDVYEGCVAAASSGGDLVFVNGEGETIWRVDASSWPGDNGADTAWMCRADATGVYIGHSAGVAKHDLKTGRRLWVNEEVEDILFGVQTATSVIATGASDGDDKTLKINKKTGKTEQTYNSSAASCAVDEKGSTVVVANRGYDAKSGKKIWHFNHTLGGVSAQLVGNKLFTIDDDLKMYDVSAASVKKALTGDAGKSKTGSASGVKAIETSNTVETTTDRSKGVEVECVKEGSKLRIRVVSAGYDSSFNVQFPRDLRVAGAHFMCDEIVLSKAGDFYRAVGAIRRLN